MIRDHKLVNLVKFNEAYDLQACMDSIRKEGCRREKNLVETDQLLMEKWTHMETKLE